MSKKVIFIIIGIAILIIGIWFWSQMDRENPENKPINREAELVLFYGRECPHCKELEKVIESSGIKEKIDFEELEVYHDKENSIFLLEKAKGCGIDEKDLGVPFFWARGECFTGAPEIENFLKEEAGV